MCTYNWHRQPAQQLVSITFERSIFMAFVHFVVVVFLPRRSGANLELFIVNRSKELNLPFVPSEMVNSLTDDPAATKRKRKV